MSSLKKFAVRTKKSFSGLTSFNNNNEGSPKHEAFEQPGTTTPPESDAADLEEFGASPSSSPSKESPSRCKKMFGSMSLRTIGSMRSLKSTISKQENEPPVQVETTPTSERPSLSALNFENSPFNQRIFDCDPQPKPSISLPSQQLANADPQRPNIRTCPDYVRKSVMHPAALADFTVGSLIESPAPISSALVLEQKIHDHEGQLDEQELQDLVGEMEGTPENPTMMVPISDALATPIPRASLSRDASSTDRQTPDMLVSSPTTVQELDKQHDYFDIPMSAVHKNNTHTSNINITDGSTSHDHESFAGTAPIEFEATQPPTSRSSPKLRPINSKDVSIPGVRSDHLVLDAESRQSLESKKDMVLAYLALNAQAETGENDSLLERRNSTWGRFSGLHDDIGYGDQEAAITTPLPASEMFEDEGVDLNAVIYEEKAEQNVQTSDTNAQEQAMPVPTPAPAPELEVPSPIDETEALNEVIQAYAVPLYEDEARAAMYYEEVEARSFKMYTSGEEMEASIRPTNPTQDGLKKTTKKGDSLYQDEAKVDQADRYVGRASEEEVDAYSKEITAQMLAEVAESVRMMNESRGG